MDSDSCLLDLDSDSDSAPADLTRPYEFLGGTQASMSPRRTECLRGAENYTYFFHKKLISQQPFIRFFPSLV